MKIPDVNGLLNYHIKGDEALLHLGHDRYEIAGIGAELHPASPEHLSQILKFAPAGRTSTVHLPYSVVLDHDDTDTICDFVFAGGSKISGFVLHDSMSYRDDISSGIEYIKRLSSKLEGKTDAFVCVEFAVGLPFEVYFDLIMQIKDLPNIGACIDIGHIGINATVADFYRTHPSIYVRDLKPDPGMSLETFYKIEQSTLAGRNCAFKYIEQICKSGAYVHFHLHDGHPMSTFSPYGVCDHLPFFMEIPTLLPEIGAIGGMYGVSGLRHILELAITNIPQQRRTFTLEVHPQPGAKKVLREHMKYFANWSDMTNAYAMNYWMELVIQNSIIFKDLCRDILSG